MIADVLPVNKFWKAVSTFVESRADVSINNKPFFSENKQTYAQDNLNSLERQKFLSVIGHLTRAFQDNC